MITQYQCFHGLVLHEIIVAAKCPLLIEALSEAGRVNSYSLNKHIGLHIKHSAKRLAPWQFAFSKDSLAEIAQLIESHASVWLALVCGLDGIVTLTADEFYGLTAVQDETARFVRVDRDRNTMYRVFGNLGKLQAAKARGINALAADASTVWQMCAVRA